MKINILKEKEKVKLIIEILNCGFLKNEISVKSINEDDLIKKSKKQSLKIKNIIKDNKINYICIERYMNRGIRGTPIEAINFFIGFFVGVIKSNNKSIDIRLESSMVWKNAFKKNKILTNSKNVIDYKEYRPKNKTVSAKDFPHLFDALMMTIFSIGKLVKIKNIFLFTNKEDLIKLCKIMCQKIKNE